MRRTAQLRILPTMLEDDRSKTDDLATTTLAEIYAQQGLYERALAIYERLADRAPDDAVVQERIETLADELSRSGEADASPPTMGVGGRTPAEASAGDAEFDAWLSQR